MPQSLSSLLVHLIFSTKDRCPFLGNRTAPTRSRLSRWHSSPSSMSCHHYRRHRGPRARFLPTRAHPKCSQGGRSPQKRLFSVAEIPRNASFCLATWLWLFLGRKIPGRGLGAIHCQPSRASSKDQFSRRTSRNPAQVRGCLRRALPMGLMDLPRFQRWVIFWRTLLGLASSA